MMLCFSTASCSLVSKIFCGLVTFLWKVVHKFHNDVYGIQLLLIRRLLYVLSWIIDNESTVSPAKSRTRLHTESFVESRPF